jgi:hypothetical protein
MMLQAVRLAGLGMNYKEIAFKLGVDNRTAKKWMNLSFDDDVTRMDLEDQGPDPVGFDDLIPEAQATLEDSPEGFRRFYERYSQWAYVPPHAMRFIEAVWGKPRAMIKVPPGFLKSEFFSVWLPVWFIARTRALYLSDKLPRSCRVIDLSATSDRSMDFSTSVAQAFGYDVERGLTDKKAPLVKEFGRFRPKNPPAGIWVEAQGKLRCERSGLDRGWNYLARGANQQIQGGRADIIVADDVCDFEKNSMSPLQRDKLLRWWRDKVDSRFTSIGRIWVVGTPQDPDDMYETFERLTMPSGKVIYQTVKFPALHDPITGAPSTAPDAKTLWPHERTDVAHIEGMCDQCRDRGFLDLQMATMGDHRFNMTYQQLPIPEGAGLWQPKWLYGDGSDRGCVDPDRGIGETYLNDRSERVRVISADPAPQPGYSGWIVADMPITGTTEDDKFRPCVLDIRRTQEGLRGAMTTLRELAQMHSPIDYLVMELNSPTKVYPEDRDFQGIMDEFDIRFLMHKTNVNKADLELGVDSLGIDAELGRISLPWGTLAAREATKLIIDEGLVYPAGRSDDLLMALWFIKWQQKNLAKDRRRKMRQAGAWRTLPKYLEGKMWGTG